MGRSVCTCGRQQIAVTCSHPGYKSEQRVVEPLKNLNIISPTWVSYCCVPWEKDDAPAGRALKELGMKGIDGPVCLTQSEPDNVYAGNLLFYDVVPPSVVLRSGFLASIVEAGGDARLPDFITLSEFKTWINASSHEKASNVDMAEACIVLKACSLLKHGVMAPQLLPWCEVVWISKSQLKDVKKLLVQAADALDDERYEKWLHLTANMLLKHATAHSQSEYKRCKLQNISDGFAKLPEHLQQRVLEAVLDKADHVGILLDLLPSQHHAAILATTITPDKTLSASPLLQPLVFAKALAMLSASPPSVLSFSLHSPQPAHAIYVSQPICVAQGSKSRGRKGPRPSRPSDIRSSAAALADALRHHSGLTSLRLDAHGDSHNTMQALAPAISTLTSLQALSLGRSCGIAAAAVPDLKIALRSLTSLQHLDVSIAWHSTGPQADRHRDGRELRYCMASVLSPVTALTSLDITGSLGDWQLACKGPLRLPCLKLFKTCSRQHNIASTILSQLVAPLMALKMAGEPMGIWQAADLPATQRLWNSTQKFTQIRSLDIDSICGSEDDNWQAMIRAGVPAAIAAITYLEDLRIVSAFPVLFCVLQQLVAREAGLRRLCFHHRRVHHVAQMTTASVWDDFLDHLSCLTSLQHLDMHINSQFVVSSDSATAGMASLQPLTGLTALHVFQWRNCLEEPEDCEALAGMRNLRSLGLKGLEVPPAVQADVVQALAALPGLTQLAVSTSNSHEPFHSAFVQHAPDGEWRALQWLGLFALPEHQAEAVVRAVRAFPVLKTVMLGDNENASWDDNFHYAVALPYLHHMHRYSDVRDQLERIGEGASINLDFDVSWKRFDWTGATM